MISQSYRTQEESVDEAKAVFQNGYAMKLRIQDEDIIVDVLGRHDAKTYLIESRKFKDVNNIFDAIREIAALPAYEPENDNTN
jgi:hypothetical protein